MYPYYRSAAYRDVQQIHFELYERLRGYGHRVEGFCATVNPPGPCLRFKELDRRWRRGDRELMAMYERLEEKLEHFDVLINEAGINLHPRFVERLPIFTVYQCFDDPESSRHLSQPTAAAYDLSLVGNIAELDTYRGWGVQHVQWTPMGLCPGTYDPNLTETDILEGRRDLDLFMMADRMSKYRKARLDRLAAAFPDAHFYGQGWPRGYLPWDEQLAYLRLAKIGPNLHNSTGPINLRTFCLPASGVLQICDNKSDLAGVYELDKEVVGFDTVEECIELCRYYLSHDRERREIAAAGWRRVTRDYTEEAVFVRKMRTISYYLRDRPTRQTERGIAGRQREATVIRRQLHTAQSMATAPLRRVAESVRKPLRCAKNFFRKAA